MTTDVISIVPEETKEQRNKTNTKIVTKTIILRIFLILFASIAIMLNNVIYIIYLPLVVKEYSIVSQKDSLYFYGILSASKDITLLVVSPFAGFLIDRVNFDDPLVSGFAFTTLSAIISAFANSYWLFFANRIFQGLASAFTDISIMAMTSSLFTERRSRMYAFGVMFGCVSLEYAVASPFVFNIANYLLENRITFLICDAIVLVNGLILFFLMKRLRCVQLEKAEARSTKPDIVSIWKLIINPYIIICAGALMISQTVISFLFYVLPFWPGSYIALSSSEITCLITSLSHIIGIMFTLKITNIYSSYQWLVVASGIVLEGVCGLIVPFVNSDILLMISVCGIAFGIALVRTIILPTLGYLADACQVSNYGSIYAVFYICYAIVDIIAPITLYNLIANTSLTTVFTGIAILNILYAPVLVFLRHIY